MPQNNTTKALKKAIGNARLRPGVTYKAETVAAMLRADMSRTMAAAQELSATGLVKVNAGHFEIQDIDREKILSRLPMFLALEEKILSVAIRNLPESMRPRLAEALSFLIRSGQVGDLDGALQADAEIEALIGEASGEQKAMAQLLEEKQEFRRAWSSHNRLGDINPDIEARSRQVSCILAGDVEGALKEVRQFFINIRQRI